MDIDVDQQGQKAKIYQKMNGTYNKYNEIDEITVPDEVKNSATELPVPS